MYGQLEKKLVKQQYLLHMSLQYGEVWPTSGWDRFVCLGDPSKFQRVSRLGSVTARQSSSERKPNFAALNRGRHVCSAGRPSRWALAHILLMVALWNRADDYFHAVVTSLWPPCVADADIIFLPCDFFLLSSIFFIPRLISAVVDWVSTILLHMVWP